MSRLITPERITSPPVGQSRPGGTPASVPSRPLHQTREMLARARRAALHIQQRIEHLLDRGALDTISRRSGGHRINAAPIAIIARQPILDDPQLSCTGIGRIGGGSPAAARRPPPRQPAARAARPAPQAFCPMSVWGQGKGKRKSRFAGRLFPFSQCNCPPIRRCRRYARRLKSRSDHGRLASPTDEAWGHQ
jgi:hypothetical protein